MGAARRDRARRARQEGRGHARGFGGAGPAGIAKVDSALSGVVEVFEDVIADPAKDRTDLEGRFAGLPFLMKDLGPTRKGRLQEIGSLENSVIGRPVEQARTTVAPSMRHAEGWWTQYIL
jgi:hypothetical protein